MQGVWGQALESLAEQEEQWAVTPLERTGARGHKEECSVVAGDWVQGKRGPF